MDGNHSLGGVATVHRWISVGRFPPEASPWLDLKLVFLAQRIEIVQRFSPIWSTLVIGLARFVIVGMRCWEVDGDARCGVPSLLLMVTVALLGEPTV